jgi:hypothetical protein
MRNNEIEGYELLKKLFGSAPENPEEEKKAQGSKNFDVLKYDGCGCLETN